MDSLGKLNQSSQSPNNVEPSCDKKEDSEIKRIPSFGDTSFTESKHLHEFSVQVSSGEQSCSQSTTFSEAAAVVPHGNLNIKCITFEDLIQDFRQIFKAKDNETETAEKYIRCANNGIVKKRNGGWIYLNLPYEVVMQVALPIHTHSQKEKTLITHSALTPNDAARNYKLWSESDKKNSPECSGSIEYHLKNLNETPIYLTVSPINIRNVYGTLLDTPELVKNRLIHLDGLHRLVALALSDNPPQFIPAYIACENNPKHINGLGKINKFGLQ